MMFMSRFLEVFRAAKVLSHLRPSGGPAFAVFSLTFFAGGCGVKLAPSPALPGPQSRTIDEVRQRQESAVNPVQTPTPRATPPSTAPASGLPAPDSPPLGIQEFP